MYKFYSRTKKKKLHKHKNWDLFPPMLGKYLLYICLSNFHNSIMFRVMIYCSKLCTIKVRLHCRKHINLTLLYYWVKIFTYFYVKFILLCLFSLAKYGKRPGIYIPIQWKYRSTENVILVFSTTHNVQFFHFTMIKYFVFCHSICHSLYGRCSC